METGAGDGAQPLGQTRQVTIEALCEHFANDEIPVEEFERRIDVAHKAESVDELKALLRDLPGGNLPATRATAPATRSPTRASSVTHAKENGFVVSVMGGAVRRGVWTPARRNFAVAIMGGTELDFREASLPLGVTEVHVCTIMGGVEIIVPPGVNVESHGIGIMGGFDHVGESDYDANAPTLRIAGVALMGGVDIQVRHLGESAGDARRRRKLERRTKRERLKDSWG